MATVLNFIASLLHSFAYFRVNFYINKPGLFDGNTVTFVKVMYRLLPRSSNLDRVYRKPSLLP